MLAVCRAMEYCALVGKVQKEVMRYRTTERKLRYVEASLHQRFSPLKCSKK